MPARFQLVIDCTDPELLAASGRLPWATCSNRPPKGDDWRRDIGLPDSELGVSTDSIIDPPGEGPRIWFHVVPDAKVAKNRLLDIHASGGHSVVNRNVLLATRTQRVDAEARRLADLGATITGALSAYGLDHYVVG